MIWDDAMSCVLGDNDDGPLDDDDVRHVTFAEFCEASDGTSEYSGNWIYKTIFNSHCFCRNSRQV